MAYEDYSFSDHRGGLNTNDLPEELAANEAAVALNLLLDRKGRLRYRGGQHPAIPSIAQPPQGFRRYANASLARLVYASAGEVISYDEAFATTTTVQPAAAGGSTINNFEFAAAYERLVWVDGLNYPRQFDGYSSWRQHGIFPPGSAPTPVVGGAGNLNGSYQYYVVFKNASGVRSNPSVISGIVSPSSEDVNLSAIATSADPQVTAREIYRVGGGNAQSRLVGVINDNTTTVYNDNIADASLSLIQMRNGLDVGPDQATLVFWHANRLFLSGVANLPFRVWYSSYGEPEYFPVVPQTGRLATEGGAFDVDPDYTDPILGLNSTGSVLVIGRRKSISLLFGDRDSRQLQQKRISGVGVAGHRSMSRCGNVGVFLGSDGRVYAQGNDQPEHVSKKIEKTLLEAAVNGIFFPQACSAYHDQRYILVIPQGTGVPPLAFALDFRDMNWIDLSGKLMNATQLYADQGGGGELLMSTGVGYTAPVTDATYNGIVSTLTRTDQTPFDAAWKSADVDFGAPKVVKRLKRLTVEGAATLYDPTKKITLTLTTTHLGKTIQHVYNCTASSGLLLDTGVHDDLVGTKFSVRLDVPGLAAGEINRIRIEYANVGAI